MWWVSFFQFVLLYFLFISNALRLTVFVWTTFRLWNPTEHFLDITTLYMYMFNPCSFVTLFTAYSTLHFHNNTLFKKTKANRLRFPSMRMCCWGLTFQPFELGAPGAPGFTIQWSSTVGLFLYKMYFLFLVIVISWLLAPRMVLLKFGAHPILF